MHHDHRDGRRHVRFSVVVAVALLAASCAGDDPQAAPSTGTPVASTSSTVAPSTVAPSTAASSAVVPSDPPSSSAPETTCQRFTDFAEDDRSDWAVVNDGVMGGRSNGALELTDSILRFTGTVVTAGGGFTSVRLALGGGELADTTSVAVRVRADARSYRLTLEDDTRIGNRPISYQADLTPDAAAPADADGWTVVTLPYDRFEPSVFGEPVVAEPFDPGRASEIGIIIADGVDGPFELDVDWIDACP